MTLAAPVLAQSPEPAAQASASAEPVIGAGLTGAEFLSFSLLIWVAALIAVAAVLLFLYEALRRYYDSAHKLARLGRVGQADPVTTFVHRELVADAANLRIEGPPSVAVGSESGDYVAKSASGDPAPNVNWTAEGAALRQVGDAARVVPTAVGVVKLTAKTTDDSATGTLEVAAIAGETGIRLPMFGTGYGSILIAIIVVAAALTAAVGGVLGGEALATLLGGLVGYLFGTRPANGGGGDTTQTTGSEA